MKQLLSLRRYLYRTRVRHELVRGWLSSPLPPRSGAAQKTPYLVVDLEMTGLDYRQNKIISMGWVKLNDGAVALDSARHLYIQRRRSVGQSAVIHQIRDVDLEGGLTEEEALLELLKASQGRALVFHSANLDCRFLNLAWQKAFSIPFLVPVVDTLALEKQLFERAHKPIKSGDLRLAACRKRYHLPDYPGHNALIDAMATAELLLAILSYRNQATLGAMLS